MHTQAITLPPNAHILVIKMAGIGDLLLATPALRALRESYPEARIDLLVTPASAGLLNGWGVLDNIIVLDNGPGWFLNVRVKDEGFGARHEAEYNLALAEAVGATTSDKRLTVPISEDEHRQAWQLLYEHEAPDVIQRPIIAMHPGSGSYSTARRWAPERFAQLADTLFSDVGGQLLLMGGPEEAELHRQLTGMMQSTMPVCSLAGKGSIKVTAALLEQADLFIGNDSALVHLAVAGRTPTVAIFGLTNASAWGPFTGGTPGQQAAVVRLNLPCMPCFYRGHELGMPEGCATRDCLVLLGVDP